MRRNDSPGETREDLARKLDELIANAEDLLRSTASYSGAEIESTRGRLKSQLDALRHHGGRRRAQVSRTVRKASRATQEYAREHAWQVWGAVAVAGLLLGLLMSDRVQRRD